MQSLPGSKESFWLGALLSLHREALYEPAKRWWAQAEKQSPNDPVRALSFSTVLGSMNVMLLDTKLIKEVLLSRPGRMERRVRVLAPVMGSTSVFTADGSQWMHQRQRLQPAFAMYLVKETLPSIAVDHTRRLIQAWSRVAEPRMEIEVQSHMSALTVDIMGQALFAHDFHGVDAVETWAQRNEESANKLDTHTTIDLDDELIQSLQACFQPSLIMLLAHITGQSWWLLYVSPRLRKSVHALNRAADQVIDKNRQAVQDSRNRKQQEHNDDRNTSLLHMMLQESMTTDVATNKHMNAHTHPPKSTPMSQVELRDTVKTFMMAGHETTATWCNWAIYALVKQPADIQEKLYKDISQHASSDPNATIDLEVVEKMEYLHAFLQEVLRMYPPVAGVIRTTIHDESLDGIQIPAGTRLVMPQYLLHRHPKYWDNPESFEPERWMQKGTAKDAFQERIRFAFFPFGAGSHHCFGYRFATIEAKIIVAELVRAFRFTLAPSQKNTTFEFRSFISSQPKPDLKVTIQSRS